METKTTLDADTLDMIQDLIQINVDSRDGLRDAVAQTENSAVTHLLKEVETERVKQAEDLVALMENNHEHARTSGSTAAAVHRAWLDIRSAVGGGDVAIISEAERGEDKIVEAYENAMKKNPASAVSDVIHRHYRTVKSAHDRVRNLRDQLANAS